MRKALHARLNQGNRTTRFPLALPVLPERFRGQPIIDRTRCPDGCSACADACPTNAITFETKAAKVDLGRCIFCTDCMDACPHDAITHAKDYRLATSTRSDLVVQDNEVPKLARALDRRARSLFGHALSLRQVSAGGCNACEMEINVLGSILFDMGRFGISLAASPRHADALIVTGPVTKNMKHALLSAYDAIPTPKLVIAVGACAISGGLFASNEEQCDGVESLLPIDLYIPGCPPSPFSILDGLLRLLARVEDDRSGKSPRTSSAP